MAIIEYKLHPVGRGVNISNKIPDFVVDGGYFNNPDDHTFIGIIEDNAEYYIPDTLTTLTLEQLQTRQRAIHAKYPMKKVGETPEDTLTDDEVDSAVKDWVDTR